MSDAHLGCDKYCTQHFVLIMASFGQVNFGVWRVYYKNGALSFIE